MPTEWPPGAPKPGEQAADLDLLDEAGRPATLSSLAGGRPLLVLVFRSPRDESGLRMLLDYRDLTMLLRRAGVSLCAITVAEPAALRFLRGERGLGFPMLADPDGTALSRWGMLDRNALFVLDRSLRVRQRALGDRAPATTMLSFVRRGGAGEKRPAWVDRVRVFLHAVNHALRPRRLAK